MKLRTTLPVLMAVTLLAAGCTSEAVEPPGLTATPTLAAEPTPSPTPSPDPALEPPDPELGIVFEDVPELSDPDEIAVYNTVAVYSKEYWRMMTTNTVGIGFDGLVSPEIKAVMQRIADENVQIEAGTRGVFHTRISGISVDGDTATAIACDDFRDVVPFDPNGTYTPEQVGLDNLAEKLTLGRSPSGGWIVLESNPAGAC